MFSQLGYKLAEAGHHACQLLEFSSSLRWLQFFDGFHLFRVRVNPLGRYHIAQQFSSRHAKYTLFRIKHHLELTQIIEGLFEVIKQIPMLF
jgi:hypothetical protein